MFTAILTLALIGYILKFVIAFFTTNPHYSAQNVFLSTILIICLWETHFFWAIIILVLSALTFLIELVESAKNQK